MEHSGTFLTDLRRNEAGNVLPLTAAAVLVMMGLVGSAVDLSRSYSVQNRLQNACDSAVLAGRRSITTNGFDTSAQNRARAMFNANFSETAQGTTSTNLSLTSDTAGNTINAVATTVVPMAMMKIFKFPDITMTAKCSSTMGVGNSDIVMVLDVTGSMDFALDNSTRLAALKTAMKNFYTTMATATNGTNARVRYGFVPFSSTVNVGKLLLDLNPNFLADTWTIQSREPRFLAGYTNIRTDGPNTSYSGVDGPYGWYSYDSNNYSSESQCLSKVPSSAGQWTATGQESTSSNSYTDNSGDVVTQTDTSQDEVLNDYRCAYTWRGWRLQYSKSTRTRYATTITTKTPVYQSAPNGNFVDFIYKPVTYDTSQFKRFQNVTTNTGDNGTTETSKWDGCIEERATLPKPSGDFVSRGLNIIPDADNMHDMSIDEIPDGRQETKWAPMWWQVAYSRNTVAPTKTGTKVDRYCVTAAQSLQVMTKSAFDTYADGLTAQGGTYLDIGMIWGARLSSPDGIFRTNVTESPGNGGDVRRHVIFMTDGDLSTTNYIHHAWGIEKLDRRVADDGADATANARHSARFRSICAAIRAKGIRVWVIQFANGTTLNDDLKSCQSPDSGYVASNAAGLNTAFQDIAKQVGELRVLR